MDLNPLQGLPLALQAVALLAVDPAGLGGLCLRGGPGPGREAVLAALQAAWPAGAPWRRFPAQVDDEALLGGLDLGRSLATGRPVRQAGLLAEAAGGLLLLPMAERLEAGLAAKLCSMPVVEDGHAASPLAAPACLVALDESQGPDETFPAALLERLALVVANPEPLLADVLTAEKRGAGAPASAAWGPGPSLGQLQAARERLPAIPFDEATVLALCGTAAALGLDSLRAPWQAWRLACAAAALAGRAQVAVADAELAARLVLAPRARAWPQAPADAPPNEAAADPAPPPAADTAAEAAPAQAGEDSAAPPPPSTPAPPPPAAHQADTTTDAGGDEQGPSAAELQAQLTAAAQAALPPGLLASLAGLPAAAGRAQAGLGRQGPAQHAAASGRPLAARRGALRAGQRLDLLATLRAAVPWQTLRQHERTQQGLGPAPTRLLLRRDDFHVRRFHRPQPSTTVFVVDASGSQALHRLAEAKGAVERLLADCYVRRDRVALIAFRGPGAETLLPPTRSLVRARRALSGLPGGGGTPLAAGIEAAGLLAGRLQTHEGGRALLVFLTDARANIARDGTAGRAQAGQDALAAAQALRAQGLAAVLIDTSPRPQPAAMVLAQAMGARYVPLPQGQAAQVYAAVAAAA